MSTRHSKRRKELKAKGMKKSPQRLTELDRLVPVATYEFVDGAMVPVLDYTKAAKAIRDDWIRT